MDRRLWLFTALAAFILSAASTFMGVESRMLAVRAEQIRFATRHPAVVNQRAQLAQKTDSTSATAPVPRLHTPAEPDQLNRAGF
ncbi:hypothetical protein KKH27_01060 [bacterium]|nr:hypothetical protein [bacterium]MBU1982978.1 hypothetical protein [bacterium]